MPYILLKTRQELLERPPGTPGELNYIITLLIKEYVNEKSLSYQTINDIVGALESCKMEFVRRVVNPYETQKCFENSDVYDE